MTFEEANLPRQFWKMNLRDIIPSPAQRDAFEAALEFPGSPPRGLLLYGPPGVGKTMLACLVGQAQVKLGRSVRFSTLTRYLGMYQRQFSDKLWSPDTDEYLQKMEDVYRLVIFDDVGKEYRSGSGWSEYQFDNVMRQRWNHGHLTILTSNLPPEDWAKRYSDSMESFLYESCTIVGIGDKDHRRGKRQH